ncbi:WD repeat-containing and planar cell polarity effector protein fritz homolog [Neosynchiropus ocellatus]
MAFCLAELHLWSTKRSLQVKDTDIGTHQVYDKAEPAHPLEHHYYHEKLQFCEARGIWWTPSNSRPDKLRDSLKDLEELLQTSTCVSSRWRTKQCCQLMLSNGVLVTLTLNGPQLEHICTDRTLVGRLPANTITEAVLREHLILLSFKNHSQVAAVYLSRRNQDSPEAGRRTEKLSQSEIQVSYVEVTRSGLQQHLALNRLHDMAVCWWNLEEPGGEMWPWSATTKERDNLLLLSCSHDKTLKILNSCFTEDNLLDCCFSSVQPYQLLTVEIPAGPQDPRAGSWAHACVYECARGRLHRLSVTRIPLQSDPVCCSRHPSETMLLFGLSDSSLVLHDQRRGVSRQASCSVPPTVLAWHPAGAVVMVDGGQGTLMCFDVGLAPVHMALASEEPSSSRTLALAQHLHSAGGLERLQWAAGLEGGPERTDTLLLFYHGGPLAALKFKLGALTGGCMGPGEFLQQRLRCGQVQEAVRILEAMNWATMEEECFRGLSSVVNFLLRLPLNAEREALLEAVLGVFYVPAAPLADTVTLEYREPISKYARRFFHHLLRHQRFEKAFLLALDLESRDLFMDLHYVARDKGEEVFADVAKRKAKEMEARVTAADGPSRVCDSRNQGQSSGSVPSDPSPSCTSTRVGGRTNRIQRRPNDITVTVNPEVFRTLIQAVTTFTNQNSSDLASDRATPRRLASTVICSLPAGGATGDAGDRNERVMDGGSVWFPQTANPGDLRPRRVFTCSH